MAYQNLTITSVDCFGATSPKAQSWADQLLKAGKEYSKIVDQEAFVKSLKDNVDSSYYRLVTFFVKDVDTDFEYAIFLDNSRRLWDVEFSQMQGDKNIDILPNEKLDLLRNDAIKKAVARAVVVIERAKDLIDNVVMQHVENGELLEVDEVKLEAIMSFLNDKLLMSNLNLRKYVR